jgi:hypothetical protein
MSLSNRSITSTREAQFKFDNLQWVKFKKDNDIDEWTYSYIIGRFGKVPRDGNKSDSPYYLVAGHGPALWEGRLKEMTPSEIKEFGGVQWQK